ncbi:NAD(P)-binding protein [Lophiostoma macrostomum CBS 122681]|uniref:NAD(P)-binding protein n=1 Tax=Lophiostoma macrostomum CBS 122681 TaxID=1314788 RepID=A0A6A6SLC2_9PLEO|nr:NAD(P)-binding protein [Lophiostoma macrostomum CBS 122681]
MVQKFAEPGSKNRIERVAIVGAGGQVGKHIAEEIMKTGKHTVTAISRFGSKSPLPKGINIANVDYENEDSIINALKGQNFLFISVAVTAPPDTQDKLIRAAGKAGVPWIMPNGYGSDPDNKKYISENFVGRGLEAGIKAVEDTGSASWVVMVCQHWYEYSLTVADWAYGFDYKAKKVTFYDDGEYPIVTTTWQQCGRAAAALVSLPVLPEDDTDNSLTLSRWRNRPLYVSSFKVSQRDMLNGVNRVMGTTDNDWSIEYEPSKDRYERGKKALAMGDRTGFGTAMYARGHFPNGDTDVGDKLDNDRLGLPKENFDEATERAVGLWRAGYNAFGREY